MRQFEEVKNSKKGFFLQHSTFFPQSLAAWSGEEHWDLVGDRSHSCSGLTYEDKMADNEMRVFVDISIKKVINWLPFCLVTCLSKRVYIRKEKCNRAMFNQVGSFEFVRDCFSA